MNPRFCRRTFMKALGISTLLLPILDLELERTARGDSPAVRKRFGALFWPNGVTDNYWMNGVTRPITTADFPTTGTAPLRYLAPYADQLIILDGISNLVMMQQYSDLGGHSGCPYLLTGANATQFTSGGNVRTIGNAASLDQILAHDTTLPYCHDPIPALTLGIDQQSWGTPDGKYCSFTGPAIGNQPSAPLVQDNVVTLYNQLTAGGAGLSSAEKAAMLNEQTSVLDYVGADLQRFSSRVGTGDQQKIAQHLQSIRDLEAQLSSIAAAKFTATAPAALNPNDPSIYNKIAQAEIDLTVAAFAAGVTSIATMFWSNEANSHWVPTWIGSQYAAKLGDQGFNDGTLDHHDLAHRAGAGNVADYGPLKDGIDQWFLQMFAYFIGKCQAIPEAGGTMLDNTCLLMFNNMGNGAGHTNTRIPFLLAGGCGGYFKKGQYVARPLSDKIAQNSLLVNIANAMGSAMTTIGTPGFGGALPELVAT